MVSDLLRQEGWEVFDLGADLPASSFVAAVKNTSDLAAVCISVTSTTALVEAKKLVELLRGVIAPEARIFVGGAAVASREVATECGADGWACDAKSLRQALLQE